MCLRYLGDEMAWMVLLSDIDGNANWIRSSRGYRDEVDVHDQLEEELIGDNAEIAKSKSLEITEND